MERIMLKKGYKPNKEPILSIGMILPTDLRKQLNLLENSETDKVKAIEELAGIKESLKSQNKKQDELILKLECECKVKMVVEFLKKEEISQAGNVKLVAISRS